MSTTFFARPLESDGTPGLELPTHRAARDHAADRSSDEGRVWVVVRKNRGTCIVDVYGPFDQIPAIPHLRAKHRSEQL